MSLDSAREQRMCDRATHARDRLICLKTMLYDRYYGEDVPVLLEEIYRLRKENERLSAHNTSLTAENGRLSDENAALKRTPKAPVPPPVAKRGANAVPAV